jgi:hypothetical protein
VLRNQRVQQLRHRRLIITVLTAWMAAGVASYLLGEGIGQRPNRQPGLMTGTEGGRAAVAEA